MFQVVKVFFILLQNQFGLIWEEGPMESGFDILSLGQINLLGRIACVQTTTSTSEEMPTVTIYAAGKIQNGLSKAVLDFYNMFCPQIATISSNHEP